MSETKNGEINFTRPETEIQGVQNEQVLDGQWAIIKIVNPFKIPDNFRNRLDSLHHFLDPCSTKTKRKQPTFTITINEKKKKNAKPKNPGGFGH